MPEDTKPIDKSEPPKWRFEPKLLKEYLAEIKFILPVFIPLPDGKYQVLFDGRKAEVSLKRIEKITPFSKFIKGPVEGKIFIPHLRYDPFNGTEVIVTFKPTAKELRKLEDPEKQDKDPYAEGTIDPGLEASLLFLNKLIRTYQYLTGNTAAGKIQPWDVGIFDVRAGPYPKSPPGTAVTYKHYGFSRPTTVTTVPITEEIIVRELKEKVESNWDVPNYYQLLLTARYLYLSGDFTASIITAQSALESYLSIALCRHISHIKVKKKQKEINVDIKKAGLYRLYHEGLKQAIGRSLSDIDASTYSRVNNARTKRNAIIHDGEDASMNEADMHISAFWDALKILIPIL